MIELLKKELEANGYLIKQADKDADILIVKPAIDIWRFEESVIIVGNDTDLLVMLCQVADVSSKLIFDKYTEGKFPNTFFNCNSFKFPALKHIVIYLVYILTDCDTKSALYGIDKNSILEKIYQNNSITLARTYYNYTPHIKTLVNNDNEIIKMLYMIKEDKELQKHNE